MTNKNEMNLLKKKGIFINQLPPEYLAEALSRFPGYNIYDFHYDKGLYIYFNFESQALTYARSCAIMINGQHFRISLAVTNLTVHRVSALLTVHELRNLMERNAYEGILFIDAVEGRAEYENYLTFREYRVILDIPEILYCYPLLPILWPEHENSPFKTSFFCRFCHEDNHKSCECSGLSRVEPFNGENEKNNECIPVDGKKMNLGQFHVQNGNTINFNARTISVINCKSANPHSSHTSDAINSPTMMTSHTSDNINSPTRMPSYTSDVINSPTMMLSYTSDVINSATMMPNHTSDVINSPMMPEPHLNMAGNTGHQLESEISNPQGTANLSKGTIQAIRNVVGNPDPIIIFIKHVRGRRNKKLKEITLAYANHSPEKVSDLIKQLELVEQNYYTSVIRGRGEDNDMKYIKNLIERLHKLFPSTTGSSPSNSIAINLSITKF